MKKIFITFMVAVSLLTFNRCTSLDMEPVSSISDANYWKSSDQFKAFNTGLHSLLRLRSYNIFVLGEPRADIYGDQPFGGEATQGVERYPYNTINAEFTGISNFGDFYETINQLNLMIRKTNETTLLDENEKNYFLGEAYGMRAYIYFHLLRSWGDVILVTEPTLGNDWISLIWKKRRLQQVRSWTRSRKTLTLPSMLSVVIILTNMEKATGLNQPH